MATKASRTTADFLYVGIKGCVVAVRKDSGAQGYCTLRSRAEDGSEVGRRDVRFDTRETRVDQVVTVRTTAKATSAELAGCTADDGPKG